MKKNGSKKKKKHSTNHSETCCNEASLVVFSTASSQEEAPLFLQAWKNLLGYCYLLQSRTLSQKTFGNLKNFIYGFNKGGKIDKFQADIFLNRLLAETYDLIKRVSIDVFTVLVLPESVMMSFSRGLIHEKLKLKLQSCALHFQNTHIQKNLLFKTLPFLKICATQMNKKRQHHPAWCCVIVYTWIGGSSPLKSFKKKRKIKFKCHCISLLCDSALRALLLFNIARVHSHKIPRR